MRFFLKIVLWCFLPGLIIPLSGQTISGTVKDQNGRGIEFASVVLWLEDGSKMLDYTTTDQFGKYGLEVGKVQGILIASSLGYRPDTLALATVAESQWSQLDFQLQTTTFELQSVEVSDSRIPYKVAGDTTTYQSEFFSDGTEQVVEDLVAKLPGVSVSDDGTIFYKGKQVDKVLLEDDELFGRKYTVGTRSLRADVVDEIQFIDHYVENQLLKEVAQSDELAMNITIKEDRKKLLFGDGSLGGGYPGKYEASANLFSLFKKHKAVVVGNAENTAGSPLDMSALFGDDFSLDNPYEYQRSAAEIIHVPNNRPSELKKAEIKNGDIYQGATNLVLRPSDKLKIRSFGLGFRDRWDLDKFTFFRDLNLGNQYEYEDRAFYDEHQRGLEWNAEALWQISGRSNVKYTFNVSQNRAGEEAGTLLRLPERDTVLQQLQNEGAGSVHRLNWVHQLTDKRVLVLDGAYLNRRKQQDFLVENSYGASPYIDQKNEHIVKDADLLASLLGKSGSLKYALSLKYRLQTDRLEVMPSTSEQPGRELEFRDHFQNEYRQQFLAMIGSFSTSLGNAELFSKLELGYREAQRWVSDQTSGNNREFYPKLHTGVQIQLTKKSTVLLSGSVDPATPVIRDLISGPVFTSYRSIFLGTDQIDPYLNCSGIAVFTHSNNAKLLEGSANIVYTNNSRAFLDRYFYDGIFDIRRRQALNGGHHWSMNGELDKYLPGLYANVGLNIYGNSSRSLVIASKDIPNEVRLWTSAIELSYTTVFDGPLNFGLSAERNWSNYRQLQTRTPVRSKSSRSGVNYFLTIKPSSSWYLKLTTRQIFTNNQGQEAKTFYLGTLRSDYQFNNGLRLGFNVYNLWNTRRYDLENLTGESYTYQRWILNPRMFLLHLGFRF